MTRKREGLAVRSVPGRWRGASGIRRGGAWTVVAAIFLAVSAVAGAVAQDGAMAQDGALAQDGDEARIAWLREHAVEVRSIAPLDEDFSDLEPLAAAIGGARVVQLGEASHADGASFDAKARLVRFLHQRLGFDALAWESGFFDLSLVERALRGTGSLQEAAELGLYPGWSKAAEVERVLSYVRFTQATARPLRLVGVDPRITSREGRQARFPAFLLAFFDRLDPTLLSAEDRADLAAWSEALLSPEYYRRPRERPLRPEIAEGLPRVIDERRKDLGTLYPPAEIDYARQALVSTLGYWRKLVENSGGTRDAGMAANLLWWLDGPLRGHKVIVWAHNAHILEQSLGIEGGEEAPPFHMGTHLARALGPELFSVGFLAHHGTTRADGWPGDPAEPVPAPPEGSLEDLLHRLGKPYLWLDLANLPPEHWLHGPVSAGFSLYEQVEWDWPRGYDAAFFIDEMRASTPWGATTTTSRR